MGRASSLIKTDLDLNVLEITKGIGFAAHNVWTMDGKIWTCDSEGGILRSLDKTQTVDLGEYPRGVAMSEDYLIVGITKKRPTVTQYQVRYGGDRDRKNGITEGGLVILNKKTLKIEKFISLVGLLDCAVADVFEIRLMDERDHALHLDEDNSFFSLEVI